MVQYSIDTVREDQALVIASVSEQQTENIYQPKYSKETWCTAWSANGAYFAWSCGNRIVKVLPWNRSKNCIVPLEEQHDEHQQVIIDAGDLVWAMAFGSSVANTSPQSVNLNYKYNLNLPDHFLATGLQNGRIRVWNVKNGMLTIELMDHRALVRQLKFAPDGSLRLASASRDGTIKMWDLKDDGNMYKTLRTDVAWLYDCAWSPDAKMIAGVGDKRLVILWDTKTLERLRTLNGHHHSVSSCAFSPDGALLATASFDTRIIIWDPYLGTTLIHMGHMFPPPSAIFAGGHNGSFIRGVSFSHDGHHLASVADDGYLRFWDIFDTSIPVQVAGINNPLCCSFSPDGAALAIGNSEGAVNFFLSPMHVSSLQHLCRMAIRRIVPSTTVDKLNLPSSTRSFLLYRDCTALINK